MRLNPTSTGENKRASAPLFEVEELGGIPVKGKSEPVPAYRVHGRKAEPSRLRGRSGHGISSPLIGRDAEFATAQSALSRLQQGESGAGGTADPA